MEQFTRFGWMLAATLLLLLPFDLKAQADHTVDRHYAVHVDGLTTADRDALHRDLSAPGGMKLIYACVPAGVLVFESPMGESKQQAKQRAVAALEAKSLRGRSEELTGGLASAEAACAQARQR